MAQVALRISGDSVSYSAADAGVLVAAETTEIALLSGNTAALAANAAVVQLVAGDVVIIIKTSLSRNAVLTALRAAEQRFAQIPSW